MERIRETVGECPAYRDTHLVVDFQKQVMDTEAHATKVIWWNRIVPYRSYVKGWKISPSHFLNQDLSTVWLDK